MNQKYNPDDYDALTEYDLKRVEGLTKDPGFHQYTSCVICLKPEWSGSHLPTDRPYDQPYYVWAKYGGNEACKDCLDKMNTFGPKIVAFIAMLVEARVHKALEAHEKQRRKEYVASSK